MDLRRRRMLKRVGAMGLGAVAAPAVLSEGAGAARPGNDSPPDAAPTEELMRQHGVVHRLLLVYDEVATRLGRRRDVPSVVLNANALMDEFIENFHEELEEALIFPRFESAGRHTGLVQVLRRQHRQGRALAQRAYYLAGKDDALEDPTRRRIIRTCRGYARMYRAHAAYEDCVLLPAFRDVVSREQFRKTAAAFRQQEREKLGEQGIEATLKELSEIEGALGLGELADYTPSRGDRTGRAE